VSQQQLDQRAVLEQHRDVEQRDLVATHEEERLV
jgi:hypothetical protein